MSSHKNWATAYSLGDIINSELHSFLLALIIAMCPLVEKIREVGRAIFHSITPSDPLLTSVLLVGQSVAVFLLGRGGRIYIVHRRVAVSHCVQYKVHA